MPGLWFVPDLRGLLMEGFMSMRWQVYMILCSDNTFYTGITTDIARRWSEHAGLRGAKYFRGRRPERIVYLENGHNRSTASQREAAIKRLCRSGKEELLGSPMNELDRTPVSSVKQCAQQEQDGAREMSRPRRRAAGTKA